MGYPNQQVVQVVPVPVLTEMIEVHRELLTEVCLLKLKLGKQPSRSEADLRRFREKEAIRSRAAKFKAQPARRETRTIRGFLKDTKQLHHVRFTYGYHTLQMPAEL